MAGVRFGINVSPSIDGDPVADARRAEELGFDFVSVNDHLHGPTPRHETWTLLSWIAASTSRIHVLPRVLGVPYRPPAVVAKMAETFDRLSSGRLILGLGGGAVDDEFRAFGLRVPSPGEKVEGLEEAILIARGMWSEHAFSFEGRHYRTEAAELEPKPERAIPIWVGTYGRRALALTGRLADGWIPSYELAPPERIPAMRDRILETAGAAGRTPDDLTCVYNLEVLVDERADPHPERLSGRPALLAEQLTGFLDLGFSGFNLIPSGPDPAGQAERLAHEVVPEVRRAAEARSA